MDTATDIAKESADLILLEKDLMVLEGGVIEGRKVFANIVSTSAWERVQLWKPVQCAWGERLPPIPADGSHSGLDEQPSLWLLAGAHPSGRCGRGTSCRPRPWNIAEIKRFILFIGPISSIFDYTTFFVMLWVFKCWGS